MTDLNMAGIDEFLKKDGVTVWMKDACVVLKHYVPPSKLYDQTIRCRWQARAAIKPWRCIGVPYVEITQCCPCDVCDASHAGNQDRAKREIRIV